MRRIPQSEVNNKAGFGRSEANVLTLRRCGRRQFGRLQGKLLRSQAFGGKNAKVAYVMGIAGTSPQILRAKGWDEFRAKTRKMRKSLASSTTSTCRGRRWPSCRIFSSRFPKGQLDAIIEARSRASAAVDFALRNGRDEIKFIVGDYPQDVRQLIHDGKILAPSIKTLIDKPTTP